MIESKKSLGKLASCLKRYPQVLQNLRVRAKPPLDEVDGVLSLVRAAEKEMGRKGRVLLRYSGTEPKVRLLIEGEDRSRIEFHAAKIIACLKATIGKL